MFASAEEAALAYNKMSRKLYGDDGKLNAIKSSRKGEEETPVDLSEIIEVPNTGIKSKRGRKPKNAVQ
jgi:hypothetical protein